VARRAPDILLLDHKLPGISGMDVLERLGERNDDLLAVMITAYASLETAITATKRGAYDFLAKPFTPEELKSTVRKAAKHLLLQRQARQLAAEKRQVRFQFIRVLGHELKAPIAAIDGYLKIMRDRTVGSDLAAYAQMIERSVIRLDGMRKLISDLLDLTRIESGQRDRELADVDVAEVARTAAESFGPMAAEQKIAIAVRAEGPVLLRADRSDLEMVLNNLVSNAVKYNRPGGRVDVTLTAVDGGVTITVADTGIGMKPEDVERLFGEFVRIKNEKTRSILGSGLGLSILKKLALLYRGDVAVASRPDVGTTFTVTLRSAEEGTRDEPKRDPELAR
jgi:signal transduction histidine kinase